MKNKLVIKELILPLTLSIMVCIGFFVFISVGNDINPFRDGIDMAYHSQSEINVDDKATSMEELDKVPVNTVVGQLQFNGNQMDIVYDCSDVNLAMACSLLSKGNAVGDVGCAYIYGYKVNMQDILSLNVGDRVTMAMSYGTYEYECVQKDTDATEWQVLAEGYDVSHGLVIYSESTASVGIGADYDIAVFELVK